MKILMTSDTFLPLIGGAEIHVKNLIERLTTHGHQVVLLTTETELSEFDRQNIVIRTFWGKRNIFRILKILWKESRGANIIHCHYSYRLATLAGIIGRLRNIPVIVTLHGLGTLDQPGAPFIYKWAHSIYRYSSLKLSTHVISTSEDLARVAYNYIPRKKITIIFNGYNEESFNPDVKLSESLENKYAGRKVILTVRRLVPKNGIHFLVESLPLIVKTIPNVVYLMAGEGRMKKYIKERISELGIGENVEMLGEVKNNDVPQLLKLADMVVFPSTAESSSIACAEAMALGKPIVASRVGGLIELLGEHNERGILVDLVPWTGSDYAAPLSLGKDRYHALAQAVIDAIISPQSEVKKRGEQIARYAKDTLGWTVISRKTEQVYKSLLKSDEK